MMAHSAHDPASRAETIRELRELITALERRVPRCERVGEIAIAQSAAALKIEALKRIEALERDAAGDAAPAGAR
jgi:hypothetical protein